MERAILRWLTATRAWPAPVRYLISTVWVAAVMALLVGQGAMAPDLYYNTLFFTAIAATALFDRGCGAWVIGFSAALMAYFVLEGEGLAVSNPDQAFGLLTFFLAASIGVLIVGALRSIVLRSGDAIVFAQHHARHQNLMFRELAHRIRNDLSMLLAILRLRQKASSDMAVRNALAWIADRVRVLGRVHDRLEPDSSTLMTDARGFITDLCDDLRMSMAGLRPITLQVKAESHLLPLSDAVLVGLVVAELFTNALKHAFPDDCPGVVKVHFTAVNGSYCLVVSDDGVGCTRRPADPPGLGQTIVRGLAAQLRGTLTVSDTAEGTTAVLRFPGRATANAPAPAAEGAIEQPKPFPADLAHAHGAPRAEARHDTKV